MSNEALKMLDGFLRAEYGCGPIEGRPFHIGECGVTATVLHWITAWNPLGIEHDEGANSVAQRALFAAITASGLQIEHGFARSPRTGDTRWNEPCAVVHAASDPLIDDLARRFRQLAIVVGKPGTALRLRCYRALWIERFGIADMDARNVEWVA